MAEEEDDHNLSTSPVEDYDPLQNNIKSMSNSKPDVSGRYQEDGDKDKDYDKERDCEDAQNMYSLHTPPCVRQRRRQKDKHPKGKLQYSKEYRDYLARKKKQPRTVANVIREDYRGNPSFCKVSGTDSDDNLERELMKEKRERRKKENRDSKKVTTKSRGHERYVKRLSDDYTDSAQPPVLSVAHLVAVPSRVSPQNPNPKPVVPVVPTHNKLERKVTIPIECPKERSEFYKLFSTLINLGAMNKKDKDKQMLYYKRQMSCEQEMLKNNLLWLQLQAWYNNECSREQHQQLLDEQRQQVPAVLDAILNFRLHCHTHPLTTTACEDDAFVDGDKNGSETNTEKPADCYDCGRHSPGFSASFRSLTLTSVIVACQREALLKVQQILDRLDKCERLYPHSKAFAISNEVYGSERFSLQVKSLCLWLNITRDLCHKMKLLGRVLGVHNIVGLDWPMSNYESPRVSESRSTGRTSIPNILEHSGTSEEDDNEVKSESVKCSDADDLYKVNKQVTFSLVSPCSDSERASPVSINIDNSACSTAPLDTSTPNRYLQTGNIGSFTTSLSRDSSVVSLDELEKTSVHVYRHFVDKSLRKMGMHRLVIRLRDLLDRSLQRAKEALQKPSPTSGTYADAVQQISPDDKFPSDKILSSSPSLDLFSEVKEYTEINRGHSFSEQWAWSEEFERMGLPSFRPSYLFLIRIPLDVIHECLRLRLEQHIGDPSFLSIRQLIRECKEVLRGAAIVKQYYQHMVTAVLWDDQEAEEKFATDLEQFDYDMKCMLDVYFSYLQNWMYMLQSLPEASRSLKNALEEEWLFTIQICPYVLGGEAEAGKRFSTLASSLLSSIADFLDNGIDEYTTSLLDFSAQDEEASENGDEDIDICKEDRHPHNTSKRNSEFRHSIQVTCRNFKNLFHEARERASKALGFAKMLRKDLEIAADFNISVTIAELLNKLQETGHVRLYAPLSAGYLLFIPNRIISNKRLILQLLNVTCGREETSHPALHQAEDDNPPPTEDGYLLMMRCDAGIDRCHECPAWQGYKVQVELTAETAIALSHIQVDALLLVVIHSSRLTIQRRDFTQMMGDTVNLINEQTSCHQSIAEALQELKTNAIDLRDKVAKAIKQVDEKLNFEEISQLEDVERNHLLKLYRETMLQCYNFGFEYYKEVLRLVSGEQRQKLGRGLVSFAKDWMKFIHEKCETGRGIRPRWANQGFDFLTVACEPRILALLTEEEFQDLKQSINDCLTHVIGTVDRSSSSSPTHAGVPLLKGSSMVDLSHNSRHNMQRLVSWPEQSRMTRSFSSRSASSEPPPITSGLSTPSTPGTPSSADTSFSGDTSNLSRNDRIQRAIDRLEQHRNTKLREKHIIGRFTERGHEIDHHISVRRVNFRWQRGIKIGEGQFGKVYTAVNVETGELMAMKEMKIQPNDQQAFREIADEIKNFEGIQHPNLVKYYGVEVHKDEMLIFMEYCDRGTIEEAAKIGLPESVSRRYTKEILIAVQHLHENSIIHRDIKGANIFITSDGKVKLGDFGCSVKLKYHTTMLGEINNLAGTMAYMAPEVITQNDKDGHGRAADIWSLGCVVVEMVTGKRPWHDAENNYQIMFKVGMGGTPCIPECLSSEGKDFLSHCFEHDPSKRWTASQLQDLTFTKVYDEVEGEFFY
ncbi:mitogen-activated protein kinase kinase kinase 4-like [Gigantopelta aegis]|uniref:mitogen-activated protein kinase kinase kinase 4-like n=1 Tax=Gigantopelta aegis TaxID=1735272 RepID=UPI001B88C468|nr:mitogen-activated protein kinase kinase kinase 4-like [Gigantopelta aegis]